MAQVGQPDGADGGNSVSRFSAIGLDHRHIYDLIRGLLEAGRSAPATGRATVAAYPGTLETIQIIGNRGTAGPAAGPA